MDVRGTRLRHHGNRSCLARWKTCPFPFLGDPAATVSRPSRRFFSGRPGRVDRIPLCAELGSSMTTGPRLGRRPREGAGGVDPAARAAMMSKVRRARARRARWRENSPCTIPGRGTGTTGTRLRSPPRPPRRPFLRPRPLTVFRPSSRRRVRPSTTFTSRTRTWWARWTSPSSPPAESIPPPPPRDSPARPSPTSTDARPP